MVDLIMGAIVKNRHNWDKPKTRFRSDIVQFLSGNMVVYV